MHVLFVSDTNLGFDQPARARVERRRRGPDFFDNFERALAPALAGKRVADRGIPVLLVLGNHERARLPYPLFGIHEHLHVFDRPRAVVLEARGVRAVFIGTSRSHRRRFVSRADQMVTQE